MGFGDGEPLDACVADAVLLVEGRQDHGA
jgi:hypothetical protein